MPNRTAARFALATMNEATINAILVTAVGSAIGALVYQFVILPWAQKTFSNAG